jgi:hypothetical protein
MRVGAEIRSRPVGGRTLRWMFLMSFRSTSTVMSLDCDVTQLKLCAHQYSCCALIIRKIRSTSSTSFRTSYSARLITDRGFIGSSNSHRFEAVEGDGLGPMRCTFRLSLSTSFKAEAY